jgi:hypothetical protein
VLVLDAEVLGHLFEDRILTKWLDDNVVTPGGKYAFSVVVESPSR